VLTVATGYDVKYVTDQVGAGREGYYTGAVVAGEPPGLWFGAGAERLGLSGQVDAEQLEAIYHHLVDPRDPASRDRETWSEAARLGRPHKKFRTAEEIYTAKLAAEPEAGPERRAELRAEAERAQRQPVAFLDVTFSAPKSVSILGAAFERAANEARARGDHEEAAAWDAHAKAVEDAVLAGARAGLEYLQDKAGYARVGHHGGQAGQWIDAHDFVAAQFLQHDNRNGDPHSHVHQLLLNRVRCADGQWRALDSRAIHTWRAGASAVSDRVCEAQLAAAFGVRAETRPDGKARELVGVGEELLSWFSSRSREIGPTAQRMIDAYRARYAREPSALLRTRIAQEATLTTRKAKSHHGEAIADRLARWDCEVQARLSGGLVGLARHVLDLAQRREPPAQWSAQDVIDRALETVKKAKASWSRSDLMLAISHALPGNLGIEPGRARELLESLTDTALEQVAVTRPDEPVEGLPAEVLLADGRSPYSAPGGVLYATPDQLAGDQALRTAAVRRGAAALTETEAAGAIARFAESGVELGADQAAAVRGVLTSGARIEVLSAAAGAGKSFTVAALADAWTAQDGRRVFALAPSQVATDVLSEEGLTARNTTAWLATQDTLDRTQPGEAPAAVEPWRLGEGDLVVVDEANMTDAAQLLAIQRRCDTAGAKLLLTGDPHQLAAVGAGGTLADLAERAVSYQLAEVHRFRSEWERHASLGLRDGDLAALDQYQRHGRLSDGGTAEQAEAAAARAWLADTLAGREALLLVGTNEAAARVSAALRAKLVTLGRVDETGVPLGRDGTVAGVGDLVQARRNGWELRGWDGNRHAPINRATYRVTGVRDDGGLTVAPVLAAPGGDSAERLGAPLQLPVSYVAADLTLGYASTVHAAEGRTVDTAHAVLGSRTDAAAAYVALTRGRERNTAHVITRAVPDEAPTGQTHDVEPRSPRAVLAEILDRDPDEAAGERTALAEQEHAASAARSTQRAIERLAAEAERLTAGRTGALLDRLAAHDVLSARQREALAADPAYGALERLLRSTEIAGHDPARVLRDAVVDRDLSTARFPAQVIHHRITEQLDGQLRPALSSCADLVPRDLPERWHTLLTARADAADERRRDLGAQLAEEPPQWAREALGPVPHDPVARAEWEHRAGWAGAHRELVDHTDDTDPLGTAPPAAHAEKRAIWRTAHDSLALPDSSGDEHEASDGALRARVRAFQREETWAPRWVGDELDATTQQAERARADAQLWAARAETTPSPHDRARLLDDAAAAQQHATELEQRAAQLDEADQARGAWYAATAATRDAAARARGALNARGIDPDDPAEQITADEWLDAHQAEQAAEDLHREITDEAQLLDPVRDADAARIAAERDADAVAGLPETAVADIRDTTEPDSTERADSFQRHRVPDADETTAAVARAQAALAEIQARRVADAQRETTERAGRREELARWAESEQATERATGHAHEEVL
jgi:conjugative relaxase-like TrwC/TraI family protein